MAGKHFCGHIQIAGNSQRNSFACGKPELTGTTLHYDYFSDILVPLLS
jgi:hypothetical protein